MNENIKDKYIHIHIPKTAGLYIKSLKSPKIIYPDFGIVSGAIQNHFTIRFLKKYFHDIYEDNIGIFSIVRNPYARIYSNYKWLSKGGGGMFGQLWNPLVTDDFETFVKDLCSDYYAGYYTLQSQIYYIDGYEELDFQFFKLEETDKLKFFIENFCDTNWIDKKVNETPGEDYRNVYNLKMIEMVKIKFEREFEIFNYSLDL